MSTELVTQTENQIRTNPENRNPRLDEALRLSNLMVKSGLFADTSDVAKAFVKIAAGEELGFGPVASMQGINIIKGKLSLGAHLIAAKIVREGYSYLVTKHTSEECEIEFFGPGGSRLGTSPFSLEDARRQELLSRDNWKKMPRNMLWARSMSNGARWYCAGAFAGAAPYTPEELGADVDENGEPVTVSVLPSTPQREQSEKAQSLNDKLKAKAQNGHANGGTHPVVADAPVDTGLQLEDDYNGRDEAA